MTRVDVSAVAREFGDAPVDAVATVRVQGWAGAGPAASVDGAAVVFSPRNEVIVQGGVPGQAIDLPPTDGTFCYRWDVSMRSGSLKLPTRYTLVPESGHVVFGELVQVSPEDFQPTPDVVAAWEAAIGEVTGLRDETAALRGETVAAADSIRDRTLTATVDPDDPDALILTFPVFMVHEDGTSITVPLEVTT